MKFVLPCLAILLIAAQANAATVLITGSSRGIGLGLARQYAERGWTVLATVRDPNEPGELKTYAASHKNVAIERLDVTNANDIAALAAKYKGKPIDVLINNAGTVGDVPKEHFGNLDYGVFTQVMTLNSYAPLAVAQAFKDNIVSSQQKKIVSITSVAGMISGPSVTVPYIYYGMSKVALNLGMRAINTSLKSQGVIATVISPGATDTKVRRDALAQEAATQNKTADQLGPAGQDPLNMAASIMHVIDGLTVENGDKHYAYDGKVLPW